MLTSRLPPLVPVLVGLVILGTDSRSVSARASVADEAPGTWTRGAQESLILDRHPGARAAYSLRRIRSNHTGPVLRIRRSSDGAERDVGFAEDGWVDVAAIEEFVASGDGYVVRWYGQVSGTPPMTQPNAGEQPFIARDGSVERDVRGNPTLFFGPDRHLRASGFDDEIPLEDYTMWGVIHAPDLNLEVSEKVGFGIGDVASNPHRHALYRFNQSFINTNDARFGDESSSVVFDAFNVIIMRNDGQTASLWQGNSKEADLTVEENGAIAEPNMRDAVSVGGGFTGTFGELVVYPAVAEGPIADFYQSVARDWGVGPTEWNREALLPQKHAYQVELYDWMQTLSVEDVRLPSGSMRWDAGALSTDELANLWLQAEGLTASSVTRAEPDWYVLDAGNGKGIEATGTVRIWDEPRGSRDYGGNPARSWANEPAFLYQLDVPLPGGGQGNPWYEDPALGRRGLVVAMVDMMMHHRNWHSESSGWYDMFGKAALSWAETYRWCGDLLPPEVQEAFEVGMSHALDRMIAIGPRAVNTNMDMFAVQAQADFYAATDDPELQRKAVQAARRALFGHTDGELGSRHTVFAAGERDGGVFDPSGFIMEGGQPDVFYGGESIYHLMGALAAVTDRATGQVPEEWAFLEEVVRRLQAWRTYQMFYDPAVSSPAAGGTRARTLITAGAGFSGRTSYGVPHGQAGHVWKRMSIADRFPDARFKADEVLLSPNEMAQDIQGSFRHISEEMASTYTGTPDEWAGWSPWTKPTPYLPASGWYGRLRSLEGSPEFEEPPAARGGITWNRKFGGHPVGDQYWSYKGEDEEGMEWGFFVEAQARQGGYGGWYGGKVETFWTEAAGVVLLNRHGKTGCDGEVEDSECFDNLDVKAGHHVWGRDEAGNGFSTLLLRGRELDRTSTFDIDGSPPTVAVENVFNDPSLSPASRLSGEETGTEIQGRFRVKNTFRARENGLEVTHTLTSDRSDEVTALWASLPVYLRHYNPLRGGDDLQKSMEDTSVEYWGENGWTSMPEDRGGDGVPALVTTRVLRLGRDFNLGDGPRYAYVAFDRVQRLRLSLGTYYDPYQSNSGVRTVHVDLHGEPGTPKPLPAEKSVTYSLLASSPFLEPPDGFSASSEVSRLDGRPRVNLRWNAVKDEEVAGYAIYRGRVAGFDTTGALLRRTDASRTTFADTTVDLGDTYYYRILTEAKRGFDSPLSPERRVIVRPSEISVSIERSFGDASSMHDYRLVALPGALDRPLESIVSGEAGVDWQAYWDDGSSDGYLLEYDGSETFAIRPGRGFWLTHLEGWTFEEVVPAVELSDGNAAVIDVHRGWNIISNPLGTDVSWEAVEASNGDSLRALWRFRGSFVRTDTFRSARSGVAYYFLNDRGLDALRVPYAGATDPTEAGKHSSVERMFTLSARPKRSERPVSSVRIGLDPSAERGYDRHDEPGPPRAYSRLSLRLEAPGEAPGRRQYLVTERRPPPQDGEGWTFDLDLRAAGLARAELRATNLDLFAGREVRLIHSRQGRSYDLRRDRSIHIPVADSTVKLELVIGTREYVERREEKALPEEVSLTCFPNPIRGTGSIEYRLPEKARVRLEVYDVLGRRVAVLAVGEREAGTHRVSLESGEFASGVYFGRLRAGDQVRIGRFTVAR